MVVISHNVILQQIWEWIRVLQIIFSYSFQSCLSDSVELNRVKQEYNKQTYQFISSPFGAGWSEFVSWKQFVVDKVSKLMNTFIVDYPLTYLDWDDLTAKTKEIITEYLDCHDIHSILNITFKELLIAVVIEIDKLSQDLQKEIKQRLNEEIQDSECKCFTGRISRLVNCLSGYSDKVCIQISETEEIGNIISVIMSKRGLKTVEILKEEVNFALKERGYDHEKIAECLEYIE